MNRTANTGGAHAVQPGSAWRQHPGGAATAGAGAQRHQPQRQPFSANAAISIPMAADHRSLRTRTTTPDSATSVENLLASSARASGRPANNLHAWPAPHARSSGSGGSRPVHRGASSLPVLCVLTHARERSLRAVLCEALGRVQAVPGAGVVGYRGVAQWSIPGMRGSVFVCLYCLSVCKATGCVRVQV